MCVCMWVFNLPFYKSPQHARSTRTHPVSTFDDFAYNFYMKVPKRNNVLLLFVECGPFDYDESRRIISMLLGKK